MHANQTLHNSQSFVSRASSNKLVFSFSFVLSIFVELKSREWNGILLAFRVLKVKFQSLRWKRRKRRRRKVRSRWPSELFFTLRARFKFNFAKASTTAAAAAASPAQKKTLDCCCCCCFACANQVLATCCCSCCCCCLCWWEEKTKIKNSTRLKFFAVYLSSQHSHS